jgi:hypothetical protein
MTTAPYRIYDPDIRLIRGRPTHVVVERRSGRAELLCADEQDAQTQAAQLNQFAAEDARYMERQR